MGFIISGQSQVDEQEAMELEHVPAEVQAIEDQGLAEQEAQHHRNFIPSFIANTGVKRDMHEGLDTCRLLL